MKNQISLLLSLLFLLVIVPAESGESKTEDLREIVCSISTNEASRKQISVKRKLNTTLFKLSIQNTQKLLHSESVLTQARIKSTFPLIFLLKRVFLI